MDSVAYALASNLSLPVENFKLVDISAAFSGSSYLVGAAVGNIVYFGCGNANASWFAFDTVAQTVTAKTSYPGSAYLLRAAAFVKDAKIYIIGGNDGGSTYPPMYYYDAAANAWTQIASNPMSQCYNLGAVNYNGYGYVYGGYDNVAAANNGAVYKFDFSANVWTKLATNTVGTLYSGAPSAILPVAGKLYCGTPAYDFTAYDVASNTFATTAVKTLGQSRLGGASVFLKESKRGYILGGWNGATRGEFLNTDGVFYWMNQEVANEDRRDHIAVAVNGKIYLIGGTVNATGAANKNVNIITPVSIIGLSKLKGWLAAQ